VQVRQADEAELVQSLQLVGVVGVLGTGGEREGESRKRMRRRPINRKLLPLHTKERLGKSDHGSGPLEQKGPVVLS
jgi:hypothetical protein